MKNIPKNKGFTLLIAVVVTSILMLISFVLLNVSLKQILLASAAEASQHAFYNAENGMECALYWDLKNTGDVSAFDPETPATITCNRETITTGSQTVPTIPSQSSVVGGATQSIFYLSFVEGCVIVKVTKDTDPDTEQLTTTIDSRGYNTCDTSSSRRFERGVTVSY